jgi:glutamyl-tRNA synthetase
VGNGRTAVLNYLFCRRRQGTFILRIEDTDIERSEALYEDAVREDLGWLGMTWDEGPYRQSDRFDIYTEYSRKLLEQGLAYPCYCTKEELETARAEALRRGLPPRYRGTCRNLSEKTRAEFRAAGKPCVIRFRSAEKTVSFTDGIHGAMTFPADHVDDFIIMRTEGIPSYNFAAAVDDLLMGITHVIRGADHLSNTPKQIMLFEAFGGEAPAYAHHSLLVGADRKPLSKRHGATRIAEFRDMGILPDAMLNYLGIVGRKTAAELLDRQELIDTFDLDTFSASDALFDLEKLLWLNKEHMRRMDPAVLTGLVHLPAADREKVAVLRENARTLNEIPALYGIFEDGNVDEQALAALMPLPQKEQALALLVEAIERHEADFEQVFTILQKGSGLQKKQLFMLLRVAITGRMSGPPLKELYRLISKDIILKRLKWLRKAFSDASRASET